MSPKVNEFMKNYQYIINISAKDITLSCHHLEEEYFPSMVGNHIIVVCNIFFFFLFFQLSLSWFATIGKAYCKQNGKVKREDQTCLQIVSTYTITF
jgi:hypothetical protein